jgi:hypothetical protein
MQVGDVRARRRGVDGAVSWSDDEDEHWLNFCGRNEDARVHIRAGRRVIRDVNLLTCLLWMRE